MADPSVGKPEGGVHHNDINEARRSSVASVNLNKNIDAKYVLNIYLIQYFLTMVKGCPILWLAFPMRR